jgi:pyrroline-5-carboxylate reductase
MRLGVIGCGKMGTALVGGALRSNVIAATSVWGLDAVPAALDSFVEQTQANKASDFAQLAESCDTFLLATKPQDIAGACHSLTTALAGRPALVISLAAGISIIRLEQLLPENIRVIRTMPNTPALVGCGASAYSKGSRANDADQQATHALLAAVGIATEVPESLLDAVTGLSGSGPAYGFMVIEALADAGVRQGLPRAKAIELAAQTMLGAAAMVLQTSLHPAVLRDMVASPGGTTIAAIAALEEHGLRHALHEAVSAATLRSKELSSLSS